MVPSLLPTLLSSHYDGGVQKLMVRCGLDLQYVDDIVVVFVFTELRLCFLLLSSLRLRPGRNRLSRMSKMRTASLPYRGMLVPCYEDTNVILAAVLSMSRA